MKSLRKENAIVFERKHLSHNVHQHPLTVDLLIEAATINPDYPRLMPENETTAVTGPNRLFETIRRNESEIYLNVLLLRTGEAAVQYTTINREALKRGDALFGSVKLVKYDVIPKSFRYRYLLSDFDLVQLSDIDSK